MRRLFYIQQITSATRGNRRRFCSTSGGRSSRWNQEQHHLLAFLLDQALRRAGATVSGLSLSWAAQPSTSGPAFPRSTISAPNAATLTQMSCRLLPHHRRASSIVRAAGGSLKKGQLPGARAEEDILQARYGASLKLKRSKAANSFRARWRFGAERPRQDL